MKHLFIQNYREVEFKNDYYLLNITGQAVFCQEAYLAHILYSMYKKQQK